MVELEFGPTKIGLHTTLVVEEWNVTSMIVPPSYWCNSWSGNEQYMEYNGKVV
jgi:hypothetical protein